MLNKVILIGRLVRDPEIKTTTSGVEVATFTLAVNRDYTNASGNYDADFINCVAYRNTAKFISSHGFKGQLVNVEGRIQIRAYEKDNQKRYVTEIIADQFRPLEWKKRDDVQQQVDNYFDSQSNVEISEDQLPF